MPGVCQLCLALSDQPLLPAEPSGLVLCPTWARVLKGRMGSSPEGLQSQGPLHWEGPCPHRTSSSNLAPVPGSLWPRSPRGPPSACNLGSLWGMWAWAGGWASHSLGAQARRSPQTGLVCGSPSLGECLFPCPCEVASWDGVGRGPTCLHPPLLPSQPHRTSEAQRPLFSCKDLCYKGGGGGGSLVILCSQWGCGEGMPLCLAVFLSVSVPMKPSPILSSADTAVPEINNVLSFWLGMHKLK